MNQGDSITTQISILIPTGQTRIIM